ncbi:MAG: hypothetical protein OYG31_00395 [Candidatus Kaiserbacteria bacterium]|nr:hypothetical protein [Candidatus Kaiserbacteria bacterium]
MRRIKGRNTKQGADVAATFQVSKKQVKILGILLALSVAFSCYLLAFHLNSLDSGRGPHTTAPEPAPKPATPHVEPVQVEGCLSGTYEGVCADHLGTGLAVLTTGVRHLKVRTGGTREFYELTANKEYEQLMLARPLLEYWDRKLTDPTLFSGERVFIASGERDLRDIVEDTRTALQVIVTESEGVRNRSLPSSIGGNKIRFTIQGMDASFSRVVTAAMYLYCEFGDGKGTCSSPIDPLHLTFKNYDSDGWVLEGKVVRSLGVYPYTRVHLSQDFIGRDGCSTEKRDTFKKLFRQFAPSPSNLHQHARSLEEQTRQRACGSDGPALSEVTVGQGSPLAQVL